MATDSKSITADSQPTIARTDSGADKTKTAKVPKVAKRTPISARPPVHDPEEDEKEEEVEQKEAESSSEEEQGAAKDEEDQSEEADEGEEAEDGEEEDAAKGLRGAKSVEAVISLLKKISVPHAKFVAIGAKRYSEENLPAIVGRTVFNAAVLKVIEMLIVVSRTTGTMLRDSDAAKGIKGRPVVYLDSNLFTEMAVLLGDVSLLKTTKKSVSAGAIFVKAKDLRSTKRRMLDENKEDDATKDDEGKDDDSKDGALSLRYLSSKVQDILRKTMRDAVIHLDDVLFSHAVCLLVANTNSFYQAFVSSVAEDGRTISMEKAFEIALLGPLREYIPKPDTTWDDDLLYDNVTAIKVWQESVFASNLDVLLRVRNNGTAAFLAKAIKSEKQRAEAALANPHLFKKRKTSEDSDESDKPVAKKGKVVESKKAAPKPAAKA